MNPNETITAIAVCTTQGDGVIFDMMIRSLAYYMGDGRFRPDVYISTAGHKLPESMAMLQRLTRTKVVDNRSDNFGDAYNDIVRDMRLDGHTIAAIANDDIVLRYDTWSNLNSDWHNVSQQDPLVSCLAARHDYVRPSAQNIRYAYGAEKLSNIQHEFESYVLRVTAISPILAAYNLNRWLNFPPINWLSDDVQCYDMQQMGTHIYVSSAYCHHVGSTTMKPELWQEEMEKSMAWLRVHRPDFVATLAK